MTDRELTGHFYIFPIGDEIWAMRDDGTGSVALSLHFTPSTRDDIIGAAHRLVSGSGARVFWVERPHEHAIVQAMLEEEDPAMLSDEDLIDEPIDRDALEVLRVSTHKCLGCTHASVCAVSKSIQQVEDATMATISACLAYQSIEEKDHE